MSEYFYIAVVGISWVFACLAIGELLGNLVIWLGRICGLRIFGAKEK